MREWMHELESGSPPRGPDYRLLGGFAIGMIIVVTLYYAGDRTANKRSEIIYPDMTNQSLKANSDGREIYFQNSNGVFLK